MKGIFIISFNHEPGAYVKTEFPLDITKSMDLTPKFLNKIYTFNRMRESKPNYVFLKVNNNQIVSFFTGLDSRICIGESNHCVCLILEDESPEIWEDELRQFALNYLPIYKSNTNEEKESLKKKMEEVFNILNQGKSLIELVENEGIERIVKEKIVIKPKIEKMEKIEKMKKPEKLEEISNEENVKQAEEDIIELQRKEISELKEENQKLKVEFNGFSNEFKNLERNFKISNKQQKSQDQIEKIELLAQKLKNANEIAGSNLHELEKRKEQALKNEELIKNLKSQIEEFKIQVEEKDANRREMFEKIEFLENVIDKSKKENKKLQIETESEDVNLELVQNLKENLNSMRKELIEAKKTIKVQRRDVVNLKQLLDLE